MIDKLKISMNRQMVPFSLFILCFGCGTPDLTQSHILEKAKKQAIPLESLDRKRIFGMIMLFVDADNEPFTGWAKTEENGTVYELGYLSKGQKQGVWLKWYSKGDRKSQIHWKDDFMSGPFLVWHRSGRIKVVGQTRDGEVDGEWKEYYENGQLEAHSKNLLGTLEWIRVFLIDGRECNRSKVIMGNGQFIDFDSNGTELRTRRFKKGIEI